MPADPRHGVGRRIAAARRMRRMTQDDLARSALVSLPMIRAIERGARLPSEATLDAIAAALALDPSRLLHGRGLSDSRVHDAMPALSAAIAVVDVPDDGPTPPLEQLRTAVAEAANWRLGAQYVRLAGRMPALLGNLIRALHTVPAEHRAEVAALLVSACRSADAVAYKYSHRDLSARLVDLMRWGAAQAEDELLAASVAYVRTETFFAARAHRAGLRALEAAIDSAPAPTGPAAIAARGALHMRAAVIAARAADPAAAAHHLAEAAQLGDQVDEDVYYGTAFGPSSVRIHQVSVAVSLGQDHIQDALDVAHEWKPPREEVPAERRSGFYIELARAQLWAGRRDDAFESLKVARRIAPQHTREHPWAREDTAALLRLKRADSETLGNFAEWIGAV